MEIAVIPRFILRKYFADAANQIHANVLLTNLLVVAVLVFWPAAATLPHFCAVHQLLNIPCPGCGVTRSLLAMAGGDLVAAWTHNPAGVFLFGYFLLQIPLRSIAMACPGSGIPLSRISRFGGQMAVFILFSVWFVRLAQ